VLYDDIPIVDVALAEHGDHSRADNASRSWLTATFSNYCHQKFHSRHRDESV